MKAQAMQKLATVIALALVAFFLDSAFRGAAGSTATLLLAAEAQTLTVTPTPTPTPHPMTIDLKLDPTAFLLALSEEQRQCVATSFTTGELEELLQGQMDLLRSRGPDPEVVERIEALKQRCVSTEAFGRAFFGMLAKSLPEAAAPGGLEKVTLPDKADGILALIKRLPTEVAGKVRSSHFDLIGPDRYTAIYGETFPETCSSLGFQALDVSTGDFYPPDWTAEHVIAGFALSADWEVLAAGQDGILFWVRYYTTCSIGLRDDPSRGLFPLLTMMWGHAASPWVFSVQAGTPEELDELVAAVVAAAKEAGP
jgi:hypothetical protein